MFFFVFLFRSLPVSMTTNGWLLVGDSSSIPQTSSSPVENAAYQDNDCTNDYYPVNHWKHHQHCTFLSLSLRSLSLGLCLLVFGCPVFLMSLTSITILRIFQVIKNIHFKLEGDCVWEFSIFPGADDILVVNIRRVINGDSDGVLSIVIASSIIH